MKRRAPNRTAVDAAIVREHPESFSSKRPSSYLLLSLACAITFAPARTIWLVPLGAAAVAFIIACSNVASNSWPARSRREGSSAVRAVLGAGLGALRRTLLAENLVLAARARSAC